MKSNGLVCALGGESFQVGSPLRANWCPLVAIEHLRKHWPPLGSRLELVAKAAAQHWPPPPPPSSTLGALPSAPEGARPEAWADSLWWPRRRESG